MKSQETLSFNEEKKVIWRMESFKTFWVTFDLEEKFTEKKDSEGNGENLIEVRD